MTLSSRGATCAENTRNSILTETYMLLREVLQRNGIKTDSVSSIIFSCTRDLDAVYPAVAARELGFINAALFCTQEMHVEGSLPRCIRILVNYEGDCAQKDVKHVYLKEAAALRPDLQKNNRVTVAVDGTSGSGKSTAAKAAAERLGITYIDSGAMYRAVALAAIEHDIPLTDETAVSALAAGLEINFKDKMIWLNTRDVTEAVRSPEAGKGSSIVAVYPFVRERLVALQRNIAEGQSVIMDGRDIGTEVFPNAEVKIFIDASAEVRARRRVSEHEKRGEAVSFNTIKREIEERDYRDKNRGISPLKQAADAVYINTDNLNLEEVTALIVNMIEKVM